MHSDRTVPLTRRRLLGAVGTAGLLSVLGAACQPAAPTPAPKPPESKPAAVVQPTAAPASKEAPKAAAAPAKVNQTTISFTSQGNKAELEMFDRIFDALEKKSAKIKVDRKYDTTLSWPKVINQLRSGTASDAIRTNDDDIFLLTSAGVITTLDDYVKRDLKRDDYQKVAWETRTGPGGELGSALVGTSAYIMFYNVDLFQKAGVKPPTDWNTDNWTMDDFEKALGAVSKKSGDRVEVYGWWSDPYWWQVGLWNEGVPWYNDDQTKAIVNVPEAKRALEKYQKWHKDGWAVPPGENATQLFNSGLLATRFSDNSFQNSIKEGVNWDVGPVFKGAKRDGCFHNDRNFTIPTHSKAKDDGWELLRWFFTFDGAGSGQYEFAKARWGIPVHKQAAELFTGAKPLPKHVQVYSQGVEKAWPIPSNPMGEAFQVVWRRADGMRTGKDEVDKFLKDAEDLLNKAIKDTGWSKAQDKPGYRLEGIIEKTGVKVEEEPPAKPAAPAKKP